MAFSSRAANLAPPCGGAYVGYFEELMHVFVRDLLVGTTVCASLGPAGPGNDHSRWPSISADGRFVAFESIATSLAPPCVGGSQVYVHDLALGILACATVSAAGSRVTARAASRS